MQVPRAVRGLLQQIGEIAGDRGMGAYAVGGCVRDWLLGIPKTTDLDVTVEGRGIEVAHAAAATLHGTIVVHQQFGTATVTIQHTPPQRMAGPPRRVAEAHPATAHGGSATQGGGSTPRPAAIYRRGGQRTAGQRASRARRATPVRVDFATCRRETYAKPAAYPRVSAGALEDDLFRRDFTINAMAVAIAPGRFGTLVDPFGGARDVQRRSLRILHGRSFIDDPSRILRGIRFAQRFGLRWEPETARALREAVAAGALGWLNAGRLQRELERMTQEPNPRACFQQLAHVLEKARITA